MFIVLEGLDGTGKSEVGRRLTEHLAAQHESTPGADLEEARSAIDKAWAHAPAARQLFYAGSVIAASETVRCATAPYVVMDRYWFSTRAYGEALRQVNGDLCNIEGLLVRPDLTVLLTAPRQVRHDRLHGRDKLTGEDHASLKPKNDAALDRAFRGLMKTPFAGHPLVVKTEAHTIVQVVDLVLAEIETLSTLPLAI